MSKTLNNLIVLEIANNHMGDINHGIELINTYSKICNKFKNFNFAFKLQYRDLDTFIHKSVKNNFDNHYVKRFSETKLTENEFNKLIGAIKSNGYLSMVTPFDNKSISLIIKQDIDILKVASCSFTDWPLLEEMVQLDKPIIASTAGASMNDIDSVISFFKNREKDFAIMHCVAQYPTPKHKLNLSQIDYLSNRYPGTTIGYSTHEDPSNFSFVLMAAAKGAKIFEKHIGLPTETYPINKYSVTPEQFERWIEALTLAITVCGHGSGRTPIDKTEQDSLVSLRRGIFANRRIKKGETISEKDIYFAFPPSSSQFTANNYSKYSSFVAKSNIGLDEAISPDNTSVLERRAILEGITKQVNKLITEAKIHLPSPVEMEISHHYGLDNFYKFGMVIFTLINRTYCKKLLISLPGQVHPAQYHKKKEESFRLVHGDLTLTIDDKELNMKLGEIITIEKGVVHKFRSLKGSIVEEISDTHNTNDSFYIDDKITKNKNRKTIINFYKNL